MLLTDSCESSKGIFYLSKSGGKLTIGQTCYIYIPIIIIYICNGQCARRSFFPEYQFRGSRILNGSTVVLLDGLISKNRMYSRRRMYDRNNGLCIWLMSHSYSHISFLTNRMYFHVMDNYISRLNAQFFG